MMILFKIVEYYPEEESISVKFCNAKSKKPIDEYRAVAIDCKNLRMESFDLFSDSLVRNHGLRIVQKQEDQEQVIQENIPEIIDDKFEVRDLVGKVIEGKYYSRNRYPIKMKKIVL